MLAYEAAKEAEAVANLLAAGMEAPESGQGGDDGGRRGKGKEGKAEGWEALPGDGGDGVKWRLPTLDEVGEELVERRRRRLLDTLG